MSKILVTRIGAIGDCVIITPALKMLKADGHNVTVETKDVGAQILRHNPNVDRTIIHDLPEGVDLDLYWKQLAEPFDKHINLGGSIEDTLAVGPFNPLYTASREEREAKCNVNYYDHTLKLCGYDVTGMRGELYFSQVEHQFARSERKKYRNKFLILWAMSGSSTHKAYPYAEYVAGKFLDNHEDAVIITVGDYVAELLEFNHPRAISKSGKWPIRKSLIMTDYADLVIGPDTGLMHAAGCFPTNKILLHSAASPDNISKYWLNCKDMSAGVECQPCYRLLFDLDICQQDKRFDTSICMAQLDPFKVYEEIESQYERWRHGVHIGQRRTPVLA